MKTPIVAAKELYDAPVLTGPDSIYAYRKLSKKEAADQASAFMRGLVKALCRIEQSKSPVKVSFLDCCDLYWLGDGWEAPNLCCLDFSAADGGALTAYRFDGPRSELHKACMVYAEFAGYRV